MKTLLPFLVGALALAGCGTAGTPPAGVARPVVTANDVLNALERPIDGEFASVSWSLEYADGAWGDTRRAEGETTTASQDADGGISVEQGRGAYGRDDEAGPWTGADLEVAAARYVDGDVFVRESDSPYGFPATWWVPLEAVSTHTRFQPWTALGYEYRADTPGLVRDPRAARLPAGYVQSSSSPLPPVPYCMRSATGTPPRVQPGANDGLWTVVCGDDLHTHTFEVRFDELGRLVWLFEDTMGVGPVAPVVLEDAGDAALRLPMGRGVVVRYAPQPKVARPDTSRFEADGIEVLDRALAETCAKSGEDCVDGDLKGFSGSELVARFAEDAAQFDGGYFDARTWGRFSLAGLSLRIPGGMFPNGATVAEYRSDTYAVTVRSDRALIPVTWCVKRSGERYQVEDGAC